MDGSRYHKQACVAEHVGERRPHGRTHDASEQKCRAKTTSDCCSVIAHSSSPSLLLTSLSAFAVNPPPPPSCQETTAACRIPLLTFSVKFTSAQSLPPTFQRATKLKRNRTPPTKPPASPRCNIDNIMQLRTFDVPSWEQTRTMARLSDTFAPRDAENLPTKACRSMIRPDRSWRFIPWWCRSNIVIEALPRP